jgi:hypothetical protein
MKNHWLEIDKEGLHKTLGQKDKVTQEQSHSGN